MPLQLKPVLLFITLSTGIFPFISGCATTGSDRAEKATTKMESVDGEIKEAVAQLDATGASLEKLIKTGASDRKSALETYSDNVTKMDRLGVKLIRHTDEMSARGKDYFDEWKKEGSTYSNPTIREISEKRSAELNTVFRKISESSIGIRGSFGSYMNDIKEIQSYLSNDLTDKGIVSIASVAEKAIRDGANLKSSIIPVLSALDTARTEMAQGGDN